MVKTLANVAVDESFLAPALRPLDEYCRNRRDTPDLSDEQFLRFGILRVMGQCDSGRDFLQAQQDGGTTLARSTWFDALHSARRATVGIFYNRPGWHRKTRPNCRVLIVGLRPD